MASMRLTVLIVCFFSGSVAGGCASSSTSPGEVTWYDLGVGRDRLDRHIAAQEATLEAKRLTAAQLRESLTRQRETLLSLRSDLDAAERQLNSARTDNRRMLRVIRSKRSELIGVLEDNTRLRTRRDNVPTPQAVDEVLRLERQVEELRAVVRELVKLSDYDIERAW